MRVCSVVGVVLLSLAVCRPAGGQVVLTGRLAQRRVPGSDQLQYLSAVLAFANRRGGGNQAVSFRTWETHPAGWYRLAGGAGNYTVVFSTPSHFMRPIVMTNLFTRAGDVLDRDAAPRADYAVFHQAAWDRKAGGGYYQPFVAKGTGVTHVGFRVAHDGVDGGGPGAQDMLVSIHRAGDGPAATWPQVGPTGLVVQVDSGGAKSYIWSVGWHSGEVPLTPGRTYAVHIRSKKPGGVFQPFWRPTADRASRCWRVGAGGGGGFVDRQLWMSVGTDGDGLLLPYHKRVHKEFVKLTRYGRKWSQTYVARGRSLAAVILYAATSGVQPRIGRQRVAVRIRRGGPGGPIVGTEKIAVGSGMYTGDASWGAFGAALAPGDVPLTPGRTYAVQFETLEHYQTLHGFVNAKGQVSDDRPGFNPYRKHPMDGYGGGRAYFGGEAVDYDLDMQIIEYEFAAPDWAHAVDATNLLSSGKMEPPAAGPKSPRKADPPWRAFTVEGKAAHRRLAQRPGGTNLFLRLAEAAGAKAVDGGWVQRVEGLTHLETYRLSGRVRCSWIADDRRRCLVGHDPTGQAADPRAKTIVWTALPSVHGVFVRHRVVPIRPVRSSISVWLRGRAEVSPVAPFQADFDDFALNRVRTDVPDGP